MVNAWSWEIYSTHADDLWKLASHVTAGFTDRDDFSEPERKFAALSTILFAAVTVEAFLNELAFVATGPLGDVLGEVEDSRGSIRLKLQMATVALGAPIDKGSEPYQSFELLFQLRDALVHLKPKVRNLIGDGGLQPKKLLAELHMRGLVSDPNDASGKWFLELLASRALCLWAIQTARDVVDHVVRLLPESLRPVVEDEIVPGMLMNQGGEVC